MDFISAKSEADAIAEERNQSNLKLADVIIKTIPGEINKNRKNPTIAIKHLQQLLESVPLEDRVKVLTAVVVKMC